MFSHVSVMNRGTMPLSHNLPQNELQTPVFDAPSGLSGIPNQWSGHPWLRIICQQTEDVSGCGERGLWASCGTTLRSLFLLQSLHDQCGFPGGGTGSAREM